MLETAPNVIKAASAERRSCRPKASPIATVRRWRSTTSLSTSRAGAWSASSARTAWASQRCSRSSPAPKRSEGKVDVLGGDMRRRRAIGATVCPRIAYMPQGLGKNLYLELSVQREHRLLGAALRPSAEERAGRIEELLDAPVWRPFRTAPRASSPAA